MNFLSLIESKREGKQLTAGQIAEFIRDFTARKIPDYQMAAMLMAIYFRGLNAEETRALTLAMRDSGDRLEFPRDKRPLVDKHSTGGIGDKVSLPLAPLLACLGFRVPMISGRGLGITGGTLDKLDSIPGFKAALPPKQIVDIVQRVGCVICGQTERMAPADKKLYALRDVTGTVPSIPLIVSSILSKKLAEGLDALVLDVKFGQAAFMRTKAEARKLARAMVSLGHECGVNTRGILTAMDAPIGRAVGNWLEVKESVACLERRTGFQPVSDFSDARTKGTETGRMPALQDGLRELVIACAAHLLAQTGKAKKLEVGKKVAGDCLDSGAPRAKWDEMLAAQGADLDAFNRKLALNSTAPFALEVKAGKSGFISNCDAQVIGQVVRDLGGGRLTKESAINHDAGIDGLARPGEAVSKGSVLARIHAATRKQAENAREKVTAAFEISTRAPRVSPLVLEVITNR